MSGNDNDSADKNAQNARAGMSDFDKLNAKVEEARAELRGPVSQSQVELTRDSNMAWRVLTDLISGPLAGCLVGWGLDYMLGTKPFIALGGFFVGLGAGFFNAYRTAMGKGAAVGFKKPNS